jgi:excisionase family DNA binding protein
LSTNLPEESFSPADWISQAEAARIRGVSRQAISKLIRKGRLNTLEVGGHVLVSKSEVEKFVPLGAGRPKIVDIGREAHEIIQILESYEPEQRRQIFDFLRKEFLIHPLENEFHAPAELILEAISRSPDISKRGVRGLIAEAAFEIYVVQPNQQWQALPVPNEASYDFIVRDSIGSVRVQVKMQRRISQQIKTLNETSLAYRPMIAREAARNLPENMFVVETQRTRGGKNTLGEKTRPYRFDDFDILAVSMYPSTNSWDKFMFTVSRWLLPRSDDSRFLQVFQPVASQTSETWTDDFEQCVTWLRSESQQTILPINISPL